MRWRLIMRLSKAGRSSLGERLSVPENWATSQEVPTLYRTIDEHGKKRIIMFSGLNPIRLSISEDEGETWSPLEPVGDYGGIVAVADMARLKDGRYMALFHDDGRFLHNSGEKTDCFVVYAIYSADGGCTWGEPVAITQHPQAHLCEPGIVRSPDGQQLCMLLRENSRQFNSMVIFSDDEGASWSAPRELPGALTGDRHQALYAPDGRLVLSFRDTAHETPTKGDWVGWVGRYDDIVSGREGQYRLRFMDNTKGADCAYPALELLPDGTIVTTTYGHWTEGEEPYIASVRFTMEELDEKAKEL